MATPAAIEAHVELRMSPLPTQGKDEIKSSVPTPPTSEDLNKHDEHNSSDLSDLEDMDDELDEGELEDIKPDHYWDEENGGKIPVFKPTMSQFRDFKKFIAAIDSYGMKSGIVKVVPPAEWHESLGRLDEVIKSIRVKNPITQEFAGTHGTYTQANIEKQRSYNLPQWKSLCEESNHKTPAAKADRRREAEAAKAARPTRNAAAANADSKRKPGRLRRGTVKEEDVPEDSTEADSTQVPPTPTSPNRGEDDDEEEDVTPIKKEMKTRGKAKGKSGPRACAKAATARGRQPKAAAKDVKRSVASRRLHNQADNWDVDEEAFEDFEYHLDHIDQFEMDRCKELEETYWKTINFGTPMYGADMPGSLFDDSVKSWNVASLPNLLDVLGTKVPGVNTAYLYLGMWKATFAWHLEDVDLYSINYIHFGAPKQWYSISQADARKFENAMRTLWPQDYKHCDQFLRHKTYLISPEKLKSQFGIKVNKLVHHEGEFVITYPYGYHSGFNLGYNCAESVNFATEDWLNYGRIAKKCLCEADSVWVDVNEIERKLRGEPTPEYYEVTDSEDDEEEVMPTPPPSVKGGKSRAGQKRKRPAAKSSKVEPPKKKIKRVTIHVRRKGKEPCILCPNEAPWDELLPTDNGKLAHKLCALYCPEVWIRPADGENGKKEVVCNVSHISKDRLDLRCNFYACRSKKGSVVQCASKKCTRAFHATCCSAAGVLVDTGRVPTWDEEGKEYWHIGNDFRCRFHRPRRPKNGDGKLGELLEKDKLIAKYGRNLQEGEVIQAMCLDGDIFAGLVLENRPSEGTVVISCELLGQAEKTTTQVEVEYKYLLTLDPAQSQRPKPSPDAKRLPDELSNTKEHSAENRKDGVPSKGDPFHDAAAEQVWEEFIHVHESEVRNPYQKKVDVHLEGKGKDGKVGMWYFLGKTSTEARPQFTHDPKITTNNPKSNFLEAVREAQTPHYQPTVQQRVGEYGPYVNYNSGGTLAPRPPVALQPRPIGAATAQDVRPYEYKPKVATPIANAVYNKGLPFQKWQVNTPTTAAQTHGRSGLQNSAQNYPRYGQNPNIPVTPFYPGTRPLQPYTHPSSGAHKSTTPPGGPSQAPAAKMTTAPSSQVKPNGTSSFYQAAERRYSQQVPFSQLNPPCPPRAPATSNTPVPYTNSAPRPSNSGNAAHKSVPKPQNIDYLNYIQKYPYLRNSYMRRPEKYASPYGNNFGFGAEYEMKLQRGVAARKYAEEAWREQEARKSGASNVGEPLPVKLEAKHESMESFQGSIKRESVGNNVHAGPDWGRLLTTVQPAQRQQAPTAPMTAPTASTVSQTGHSMVDSPYGPTANASSSDQADALNPTMQNLGRKVGTSLTSSAMGRKNSPARPEYSPISGRASPANTSGTGVVGLGILDGSIMGMK